MTDGYFNVRRNSLSVLKKTSVATFPKIALVKLTNACNHECIFCTNPLLLLSYMFHGLDRFAI